MRFEKGEKKLSKRRIWTRGDRINMTSTHIYHLCHWSWQQLAVFCNVDQHNHTLVGGVSVNSGLFEIESDVTWWPINRIHALHLPIQMHTHSSEHTHTVNTHPEHWATIYAAAPGEQLGVRYLAQGHLVVVLKVERAHSLPSPTIPAGPRLEFATFRLWVRLSSVRPRLPDFTTSICT